MTFPGPIYVDTSALVKLYLPEPGSDELGAQLIGRRDLIVAELAMTEFASAISRRKREGGIDGKTATTLYMALLGHLEGGYFIRADVSRVIYRSAERTLLTVDGVVLRAADALHLAIAISAEARTVATSDLRMQSAARHLGLNLLPA